MIELHNNNDLKNVIDTDKKFNPNQCLFKKSLIHCSIYCDNFEAYQMLINHPKFDPKTIINHSWIEHMIKRYGVGSNYENTRYLEEIMKTNIVFNSSYIRYCNNISVLEKLMNNIDTTNPTAIIKDTLRYGVNDDIQLFIVDNLLTNKPELFTKQFVDTNILSYALSASKIGLIELLKKYNIDTKTCNGKPSLLQSISGVNTYGPIKITDLAKYLLNENHFYNENLLDKKWYSAANLYNANILIQLEFVIDNLEKLKQSFEKVTDDNYELLNLLLSELAFGNVGKYATHYIKNKETLYKRIFHFLLGLNPTNNVFEKLLWTGNFEKMFIQSDQKTYNAFYNLEQRQATKTFLGCALCYYQPTLNFQKIIEKAFSLVELENMDKLKETYKLEEPKVVVKKKATKQKVMTL